MLLNLLNANNVYRLQKHANVTNETTTVEVEKSVYKIAK